MSNYGEFGGIGSEEIIKEWFQKSGWTVTELRKAADGGRAPVSSSQYDDIRNPDFAMQHPDHGTHIVEVKRKTEPWEYGVEDSIRHGYEKPKHDDYVEYRRRSGLPVWIMVHESKPGVILRQRVQYLHKVQVLEDIKKLRRCFGTSYPMVFFERSQFAVAADDISQLAAGFAQSGLLQKDLPDPLGFSDGQSSLGQFDRGASDDD